VHRHPGGALRRRGHPSHEARRGEGRTRSSAHPCTKLGGLLGVRRGDRRRRRRSHRADRPDVPPSLLASFDRGASDDSRVPVAVLRSMSAIPARALGSVRNSSTWQLPPRARPRSHRRAWSSARARVQGPLDAAHAALVAAAGRGGTSPVPLPLVIARDGAGEQIAIMRLDHWLVLAGLDGAQLPTRHRPHTSRATSDHVGGGRMSDQLVTVASKSSALGAAALEPKPQSFQASTRTNRNASFATGAKTPCFMLRPHTADCFSAEGPRVPGPAPHVAFSGGWGVARAASPLGGFRASRRPRQPPPSSPPRGLRPLMANFGRYWVRTRRCVPAPRQP
jgi:hypothetical protein